MSFRLNAQPWFQAKLELSWRSSILPKPGSSLQQVDEDKKALIPAPVPRRIIGLDVNLDGFIHGSHSIPSQVPEDSTTEKGEAGFPKKTKGSLGLMRKIPSSPCDSSTCVHRLPLTSSTCLQHRPTATVPSRRQRPCV